MIKSKYNIKVALLSNDRYGEGLNDLEGTNYITNQLFNYFKTIVINSDKDILFLKDINYTEACNKLIEFIKNIGMQYNCIFIFYFCGHGKLSMNKERHQLSLALMDTTAYNFDIIGIKFNEILNKINESNIKRFICIIDSCCSGLINSMGTNEKQIKVDNFTEGSVYISSVKGTSKAYEVEVEGEEKKLPWFSYCFWKSLITLNDMNKLYYSINDIFEKTKKIMSEKENVIMEPGNTYKNKLYDEEIFPNINKNNNIYEILDVIDWRITTKCNNQCKVCYACNDNKQIQDLSEEKIDTILKKISHVRHKSICISGGEPTCSKYFVKIIHKLYKKGFSIFLSTNGYKYMEYQDEIERYIDKLSLPLDGGDIISNCVNGRDSDSFLRVKNILDYYKKNKPKFPIKISTVLTRKTNDTAHLEQIMNFLKGYNISIWKIYEFIPENRGFKNKELFSIPNAQYRIRTWVNDMKKNCDFKIEFVRRENRDAAYFIIQANGDVIIPIEKENMDYVDEKIVGNIINDDFEKIINEWNKYVDKDKYLSNIKLRKIKQLYSLKSIDKKILLNIIARDNIPSLEDLSKDLQEDKKIIEKKINDLYEHRIIKRIIPIINLSLFKIYTYLATITLVKSANYPENYFEEYLCYNAHIGWVTKCEKNTYRIAIFAKNFNDASAILQDITDLNDELQYELHPLLCSYSIGEEKLFLTEYKNDININKYNSNEQNSSDKHNKIKLTYDEFYVLKQIEELRKPMKENIDEKAFLQNYISINKNLELLKKKGVIEQLSIILDTRLLGYDWYIVFIQISNNKVKDLIEFLRTCSSNITHINHISPNNSGWNLDFEIHSLSFAEVEELIENIEQKFNTPNNILKIIRECKFSFLTHFVLDIIKKYYMIEKEQGEIVDENIDSFKS